MEFKVCKTHMDRLQVLRRRGDTVDIADKSEAAEKLRFGIIETADAKAEPGAPVQIAEVGDTVDIADKSEAAGESDDASGLPEPRRGRK